MMGQITIRAQGFMPGFGTQRHLNSAVRSTWEHVGRFWHRMFRPKHFTEAGAREYGYIARKGERMVQSRAKGWAGTYVARKKREKGHNLPLVWSGDTRELSRQHREKAAATRKRSYVKVIMPVRGLNRKHPKSQINMAEEMRRISPAEDAVLTREHEDALLRRLDTVQSTVTIVI